MFKKNKAAVRRRKKVFVYEKDFFIDIDVFICGD